MRLSVSFERHNQTFNYLKIQKHHYYGWTGHWNCTIPWILQSASRSKAKGMKVGEAHLYFGCRHPEKDYLYRTELENDERGINLFTHSFSRLEGHPKTYVQHVIKIESI